MVFVSLSQASLMDTSPDRHDQNMARWTLAGSLGVVAGPLLLAGAAFFGSGWTVDYATKKSLTAAVGQALRYPVRALMSRNIDMDGISQAACLGSRHRSRSHGTVKKIWMPRQAIARTPGLQE